MLSITRQKKKIFQILLYLYQTNNQIFHTMKTHTFIITAALMLSSCQSLIDDIDYLFLEKVSLKGKVSQIQRVSDMSKAPASPDVLTLADATKVMIFYANEYVLTEIESDGEFSKRVPIGNSTVVAFLSRDNKFIGNLYTGGLNFLPLGGLDDNVKEIDLSTLTLEGSRVIPANDPIGKTIMLSEGELDFMKEIGIYYENLANNIDMDRDGTPDILKEKELSFSTRKNFEAGKFGIQGRSEPQIAGNGDIVGSNFIMINGRTTWFSNTKDPSILQNAVLSGPLDNPHSDIMQSGNNSYGMKTRYELGFERTSQNNFNSGEYDFTIDNTTFRFNYFFDMNLRDYWVYPVPTLHLNSAEEVSSVTYSFRLPDGREVDPRKVLSSSIGLMFNVTRLESNMDEYKYWQGEGEGAAVEIVRQDIMSSLKDSHDFYRTKLKVPIKLSNIRSISTTYYDMFGNRAINDWMH